MPEMNEKLRKQISDELKIRFPDMKPKIAEIKDKSIIYELEKHGNFTYYSVNYNISREGDLKADWDNAELTVF
jgi:hypothetical protein